MVGIDYLIGSKEYESYGRIKICDSYFIHMNILYGVISIIHKALEYGYR